MIALKTLEERVAETDINDLAINDREIYKQHLLYVLTQLEHSGVFKDTRACLVSLELVEPRAYKGLLEAFRTLRILSAYHASSMLLYTKLTSKENKDYVSNIINETWTLSTIITIVNKTTNYNFIMFTLLNRFINILKPFVSHDKLAISSYDRDIENELRKQFNKQGIRVAKIAQLSVTSTIKRVIKTL